MVLVDTSAWIEFDRATGSPVDVALTAMIAAGEATIAVTETVHLEVLAGAKDERRHDDLRRLLCPSNGFLATASPILRVPPVCTDRVGQVASRLGDHRLHLLGRDPHVGRKSAWPFVVIASSDRR